MNIAKILHNKAMEFADEAKLARMEGNNHAAIAFLKNALTLEKEAIAQLDNDKNALFDRFLYVRSAAFLAYDGGQYLEAEKLTNLGLSGNPPAFIKEKLLELKKKMATSIVKENKANPNYIFLQGFLAAINLDKGKIEIRQNSAYQTIKVPNQKLSEIQQFFLGRMVEIMVVSEKKGSFLLEEIKWAA